MEKKLSYDEFWEYVGGEQRANALLMQILNQLMLEDRDMNECLNDKNRIVYSCFYTIIENNKVGKFGLAIFCQIKRGNFEPKPEVKSDVLTPLLIYVTDPRNEMPDCVLDMISLQKRMSNTDSRFSVDWFLGEIEKFK